MLIKNAKVFIDGNFHDTEVQFDEKGITAIGKDLKDDEVIDAHGNYLFAGLIDAHVHGGWGRSLVSIENTDKFGDIEEQISYLCNRFPSTGVTTFFPTINADWSDYETLGRITRAVRNVKKRGVKGAYPLKNHYECAFLTLERYVDQCKDWMAPANIRDSDIMVDYDYSDIGIISLAPETEGALDYIDYIVSKGVMPEIGYDNATAEQVIEAADHGLCQATHLYNGYRPMHHRESNANAAVLYDDRIKAQLTMDGVHVNPFWVKLTIKIKGIDNVYGITDFSSEAGLEEGWHQFGNGMRFLTKDGFNYHENGHLCGGSNAMNDMMRRAHNIVGLTREEVGSLYSESPAKCLNITDRGKIEVGRKSDFVIMDPDYNVETTIIDGKVFYQKAE